ncbi:Core-binding (CB) domain-containing protein, partial [Dysosmobacter welbionis]
PVRRRSANSSRVGTVSAASMSAGTSRTSSAPAPKSSQAKPNCSSRGRFSSSSAPSSRLN